MPPLGCLPCPSKNMDSHSTREYSVMPCAFVTTGSHEIYPMTVFVVILSQLTMLSIGRLVASRPGTTSINGACCDVRVVNPNTQSYYKLLLASIYQKQEREKQRKYEQRICEGQVCFHISYEKRLELVLRPFLMILHVHTILRALPG